MLDPCGGQRQALCLDTFLNSIEEGVDTLYKIRFGLDNSAYQLCQRLRDVVQQPLFAGMRHAFEGEYDVKDAGQQRGDSMLAAYQIASFHRASDLHTI
jgi:hypothetical protein